MTRTKTFLLSLLAVASIATPVIAAPIPSEVPKHCREVYQDWVGTGFEFVRYIAKSDELQFYHRRFNTYSYVGCVAQLRRELPLA
jgi:hypothetical protein